MSVSIQGMTGVSPMAVTGASMRMPPTQKMSNLFSRIDTAGTGSINKSQFEQAFKTQNPPRPFQQAGAQAVWAKLDPTGSGSVSKSAFVKGMTALMSQLRQGNGQGGVASGISASATISTAGSELQGLPSAGGINLSA